MGTSTDVLLFYCIAVVLNQLLCKLLVSTQNNVASSLKLKTIQIIGIVLKTYFPGTARTSSRNEH